MASGPFVFSQLTKLNMFEGATGLLKTGSALYRLVLVTNSWVPAPTTDELYSVIGANELATGFGYTSGGGTLTSVALTQSAGVVKFTSAAFVWTASAGSIPLWRYGVIYYLGTLNSKLNPLVGYFLGDSTPADVPATTSGNTLTVTPNASGIMSAT